MGRFCILQQDRMGMMALRQHEIEQCAMIAQMVIKMVSGGSDDGPGTGSEAGSEGAVGDVGVAQSAATSGGADSPGEDGPGCSMCGGDVLLTPCPVCKRGPTLHAAATAWGSPEVEHARQVRAMTLLKQVELLPEMQKANESLRQALVEVAAERDADREALAFALKGSTAIHGGGVALIGCLDNAFKMFFSIAPVVDGQQAMYPLRGEHLANFRKCQQRADALRELLVGAPKGTA